MILKHKTLEELENELSPEFKAILKCLRENLKNYMEPNDDPDFWINEVICKSFIMEEVQKDILAVLWAPLVAKSKE